ncbi:MAG: FAD-dependent oxidoreductase [Chloroflexi bacterium]|nr:FAD-dependent oxidoreductase [Chloroflexota bacterium]
MQTKARLVIIGAGIVGCSTAYHLAQKGWRDIVVLDQNSLYETSGSTSHAPGLIFQTNSSRMMCEFAQYTVKLFDSLHTEAKPTWYSVGSIEIACTQERLADLHRRQGWAAAYNLEGQVITPAEVVELIPLIDPKTIYGGYYVPTDGDTRAVNAASELARLASAAGAATFYGDIPVTDIEFETHKGHVAAVVTPKGRIEAEQVLLCTNIWGPVLGDKVGVKIPLMAVEHLYTITTPLPELAGETRELVHPVLRDQDHAMYYRQYFDQYGVGSYQHEPLLVNPYSVGQTAMREFTPEHFSAAWNTALEIMPALKKAQLATKFNGMFAFTIDGMPILGESALVKGFWTAVAVWVTHSGGVGKVMAEWLADGVPSLDLREADVNRFHSHATTKSYILDRCYRQYDEVYDIIHPLQQMENPRQLRLSPFYPRLQAQQGVFFEAAGWERPQWLEANAGLVEAYEISSRSGWAARYWSPIQGGEHLATRERVAMYDLTAFTKLEVSGPGVLAYLQYIAANQMDLPIGKVVYTSLLNQNGGIKCDLTITRLDPNRFWVLTGGGTGMLDLAWLRQHTPTDGSVEITDVTSKYCNIGLWGPKARTVLQKVCHEDVSNEAFPYFTARHITIGYVPALALRVSYVGELGWEIYTLTEYGLKLWDMLWEAGQEFDIIAGGFGAFDSLRLEKGYRSWGADIHTEYNPYEAGLGWTVKLDKGDFLGREALLRIKEAGVGRKLCCMTLDDPQAVAIGKEPIYSDGQKLGYVTSANYGYSVGKFIVYGYLPVAYATEGAKVEVEYFGQRYTATVTKEPLYDAKNVRLKG